MPDHIGACLSPLPKAPADLVQPHHVGGALFASDFGSPRAIGRAANGIGRPLVVDQRARIAG